MGLVSWYKKDPLNIWLSAIVFLFVFIVYLYAMAPTVSFWDCGEFIACSYILGVPHPPGTPLFILIGRVFSLLPLFGSIAPRVNFVSVLSSALTVWLAYLLIVRIAGNMLKDKDSASGGWTKVAGYVGGISGSLFLGFSMTYWSNAVEAEVYGVAMLMMVLIAYLGLLWLERKGEPGSDRLLVLIGFLGMLSIGVHMTVYLIMPAIFLLVIIEDKNKLKDIRFWVSGIVLSLVMFTLVPFLISLLLWLLVSFIFWQLNPHSRGWNFVFALILFAVIGYTVQLYIPIRSRLEPAIDENDPNGWAGMRYFLERKQYGQVSMVDRMFTRRGSWKNQLGVHERMGFWGFFREQYLDKSLWIIPILLGFLGVFESIRRVKGIGWMLLFLVLVSSIGLVLYLNFGDGTRTNPITGEIERLEVRDRDYFFTPAFVLFALAMGLGISRVLSYVSEELSKLKVKEFVNKFAVYGLSAIFLLAPILPLDRGLHSPNNRRNNYIPYDYAYNILSSCEQDAILFTNGDNDTFPLWFIQEVENVRKDVRVINLSLANTNWYMKQRKNLYGVPLSFSDRQIDNLVQARLPNGIILRVQDQIVDNILETNRWRYPVYFSSTVSPDNRVYKGEAIDDHLILEGKVYRVVAEERKQMVNVEKTERLLNEVLIFRGLSDPRVYKDWNDERLVVNYSQIFLNLADTLRRAKEYEKALQIARRNIEVLPYDWRPYAFVVQVYAEMDKPEKAEEFIRNSKNMGEQRLYFNLGYTYNLLGKEDKAIEIMHKILSIDPSFRSAYEFLVSIYYQKKDRDSLEKLVRRWITDNPTDDYSVALLAQITKPEFVFPKE
jgi:tetratricopeptide (TPR) repeat protein